MDEPEFLSRVLERTAAAGPCDIAKISTPNLVNHGGDIETDFERWPGTGSCRFNTPAAAGSGRVLIEATTARRPRRGALDAYREPFSRLRHALRRELRTNALPPFADSSPRPTARAA